MNKHYILLIVALSVALSGFSQKLTVESETETKIEEDVYTIVEEMPEFPGGKEAMFEYMQEQIEIPEVAKKNKIEGTVFIHFTIARDGKIKDAYVLRGVHPALDREALRVVNAMPNWEPGRQRGKPVAVAYNFPVKFSFGSGKKVKKKKK